MNITCCVPKVFPTKHSVHLRPVSVHRSQRHNPNDSILIVIRDALMMNCSCDHANACPSVWSESSLSLTWNSLALQVKFSLRPLFSFSLELFIILQGSRVLCLHSSFNPYFWHHFTFIGRF